MKPVDFVVHDGDSCPNMPVLTVYEAMQRPIVVVGPKGEYEILSYFINHNGVFQLDIQRKKK
jgi:hypothetical protein